MCENVWKVILRGKMYCFSMSDKIFIAAIFVMAAHKGLTLLANQPSERVLLLDTGNTGELKQPNGAEISFFAFATSRFFMCIPFFLLLCLLLAGRIVKKSWNAKKKQI